MDSFEKAVEHAFADVDLRSAELPKLELYMDQVLTLLNDGLSANKRRPADRLLTKTMINNYSKEHIIMPIKGKKYSREQVMQLLCVLNLKQVLELADVKTLLAHPPEAVSFEAAYDRSLELKERLRQTLPSLLLEELGADADPADGETRLALALALASAASELRRVCEGLVDGLEGTPLQ